MNQDPIQVGPFQLNPQPTFQMEALGSEVNCNWFRRSGLDENATEWVRWCAIVHTKPNMHVLKFFASKPGLPGQFTS